MWRIFILIPVSVTLTSAATCPNMRSFRNAALLVGISGPAFQEGPRDLQFAGADADLLQNLFAQQFGPENVFELKNSEATTAQVSGCLDGLARWAQPGSKVIVFISARGFSSSQMDDGYVVTSDAAIDKLPRFGGQQAGNGISIQTLRRKMSAMQAREKYLLLDLCRDPAETPAFDNLINNRLLDKKFLDAATRQIVLASNGSRRSFESAELHNGFYASSLADALKAAPGSDLLKIFEDLRAKLKLKSRARQTPDRPAPAPGDGWQDCPFCKLSRISGSLLASLSPEFVFQAGPPAAPASDLSDDLSSDRNNDVSDESEASDREESLVSSAQPAVPGEQIAIALNGMGFMPPAPSVILDGKGLDPGLVVYAQSGDLGYQVGFIVPSGLTAGAHQLSITENSVPSNTATLLVGSPQATPSTPMAGFPQGAGTTFPPAIEAWPFFSRLRGQPK
jgi:hypothetical protein